MVFKVFNCSAFPRVNQTFCIVKEFLKDRKKLRNNAYFCLFTQIHEFLIKFKNKTLRPIDSSTSGDILIIIKSDVCFKMAKNTFFNVLSTASLKNVFFVILKHTSDFMMIKMSREVEESIGRSVLFLKFCQKLMNSRK